MEPRNIRSLEVLKNKHTKVPNDRMSFSIPGDDIDPLQILIELVRDAINSFAPISAGGPSGLQPQHLKDSILRAAREAGNKTLTAITSPVNIITAGIVPSEIAPVLSKANVFALKKKDGGKRPIAVGETLSRIPAKCASKIVCHIRLSTSHYCRWELKRRTALKLRPTLLGPFSLLLKMTMFS